MKKIIVYTSPACFYCHQLKDFLREKGLVFEEIDLSEHQDKIDWLIKKTGQMSVPVTEIDGEMVVGFNQIELKNKLGIK
jgi:glutaredoxin